MKRILCVVLLAVALAVCAPAAIVDFSSLSAPSLGGVGPRDIMSAAYILGPPSVSFSYDPTPALPLCIGFNGGEGAGWPFDFVSGGCVAAQVDVSGLNGTTDGVYVLGFASPVYQLSFDVAYLYSVVDPPPDPADYGVTAVLRNGGVDIGQYPTLNADHGTFSYVGPAFTEAWLYFSPVTVSGAPVGQAFVSVDAMSFSEVPEPGSAILLVLGLAGLGVARLKRRQ